MVLEADYAKSSDLHLTTIRCETHHFLTEHKMIKDDENKFPRTLKKQKKFVN